MKRERPRWREKLKGGEGRWKTGGRKVGVATRKHEEATLGYI